MRKGQGMVQFPGTVNSSGREFITNTTREGMRRGKLSQGKMCGESQLIETCYLPLKEAFSPWWPCKKGIGKKSTSWTYSPHIHLRVPPNQSIPTRYCWYCQYRLLLKHSNVRIQGNGPEGAKEDGLIQRWIRQGAFPEAYSSASHTSAADITIT